MSEKKLAYILNFASLLCRYAEAWWHRSALVRLRALSSRDAEKFKNQQKQHPRIAGRLSARGQKGQPEERPLLS